MGIVIDIKGQKFGMLTAFQHIPAHRPQRAKWLCRCDCGKEVSVDTAKLKSGHTKSCGCQSSRLTVGLLRLTHGHNAYNSPEYRAWRNIKVRCYHTNNAAYPDYGGRGIKMCDRWLNSFEDFLQDVGKRPSPKHTLDRYPNNDGDYEPNNFRWGTRAEQARNKRDSLIVQFNGQKKPLADFCDELKLNYKTIWRRLDLGWTVVRALGTAVKNSYEQGLINAIP